MELINTDSDQLYDYMMKIPNIVRLKLSDKLLAFFKTRCDYNTIRDGMIKKYDLQEVLPKHMIKEFTWEELDEIFDIQNQNCGFIQQHMDINLEEHTPL